MLMHGEEKGVIRHSEVSLMRMWCVHMPEVSVSKRRCRTGTRKSLLVHKLELYF